MSDKTFSRENDDRFSPIRFILVLSASYFTSLLLLLILPSQWRESQLIAPKELYVLTFILCVLFNSLVEWAFHRAVLHAPLFPYLLLVKLDTGKEGVRKLLRPLARAFYNFYVQHDRVHHKLTDITCRKAGATSDELRILNMYPIVEEHQHRASYFPWHTYFLFTIFAFPFFSVTQALFPRAPVFIMGLTGLALSLTLYEIRHAADHWPEEKLARLFKLPLIGSTLREWFKFHRGHHASIRMNMAISGFFLIPLWDYVFRTQKKIKTFYPNGEPPYREDFVAPQPRFIGWLDKLIDESRSWNARKQLYPEEIVVVE